MSSLVKKMLSGNLIHWLHHIMAMSGNIIRSVRKILRALLGQQLVSDEMLRTLMTEVQGILNSQLAAIQGMSSH